MENAPNASIVKPKQRAACHRQLQLVQLILDSISPFPARKGLRRNVMQMGQDRVTGFTLGLTKKLDVRDKLVPCRYNAVFPELHLACNRLMQMVDPGFAFNCIQVNKNQQSAKHTDAYNMGPSYIVAFGDYRGGELLVHCKKPVTYDIDAKFLKFDGRVAHETLPFKGTRYSLVFFKLSLTHTKEMTCG